MKLWMGDLEPWMDEAFILRSFQKFGFHPISIEIIRYKKYNILSSFCYISFDSFMELNEALLTLNTKKIPNTNYYFKLNLSKSNKIHDKNIYVGNLSPKVTDMELYFLFKSKYSSVYFASIIRDNGVSRGYGFVHLGNDEEYNRCLKEMNGVFYQNKILKVKEKNNKCIWPSYKYNNYFSDLLKSEEIKAFFPKVANISIKNKTIIPDGSKNGSKINTSNPDKKKFSEQLEMLKNNDSTLIFEKINESVDKIIKYKTMYGKENEIPKILSYYHFSKQ